MPQNFDTFGQISPLAISNVQPDAESQQLDSSYFSMAMNYEDSRDKVLKVKEQEMVSLGDKINEAHEQTKNTTFIKDPKLVEDAFNKNLTQLKELYKVPSDQRNVEWNRQLSYARTNINSPAINNDIQNKTKYDSMFNLYSNGKITKTAFDEWDRNFRTVAEKGEKYTGPEPVMAHEEMWAKGIDVLNNIAWRQDQMSSDGTIDKMAWDNAVRDVLTPEIYPEADAKYSGLSESDRKYYEDLTNVSQVADPVTKKQAVIKYFVASQFASQRYKEQQKEAERRRMSQYSREPKQSAYELALRPWLDRVKEGGTDDNGVVHPPVPQTFSTLGIEAITGSSTPTNISVEEGVGKIEVERDDPKNPGKKIKKFINLKVKFDIPNNITTEYKNKDRNKHLQRITVSKIGGEYQAEVQDEPILMSEPSFNQLKDSLTSRNFTDENGNSVDLSPDELNLAKSNLTSQHFSSYTDTYGTNETVESEKTDENGLTSLIPTGVKRVLPGSSMKKEYVINSTRSKGHSLNNSSASLYDMVVGTAANELTGRNSNTGITPL